MALKVAQAKLKLSELEGIHEGFIVLQLYLCDFI